jgi:hypothetical protein
MARLIFEDDGGNKLLVKKLGTQPQAFALNGEKQVVPLEGVKQLAKKARLNIGGPAKDYGNVYINHIRISDFTRVLN